MGKTETSLFVKLLSKRTGYNFQPASQIGYREETKKLFRKGTAEDYISIETVSHLCGDYGRFLVFAWFPGREVTTPHSVYHVVDTESGEVAFLTINNRANEGTLNIIQDAVAHISAELPRQTEHEEGIDSLEPEFALTGEDNPEELLAFLNNL